MKQKKFPKENMSLYRKLFSNEVKSEIEKYQKANSKRHFKGTDKYLEQIEKLLIELREHKISNENLIDNKVVFRHLKREHAFLRNRLYFILGGIAFVIAIIVIILLGIFLA
ncbi:hypothetical protein [Mycoplasma seminis]|uniref:Uncharacterized protein n=1 Tax=Mycoplasma seminis TaxID=512749 RepID=A0ABY9HCD1_9MOLU|nr:hypothetical protein [Mycoplasma seminis]WLP85859.1 hypothetical protein Q8852_01790 [Mycoplasma seminis]